MLLNIGNIELKLNQPWASVHVYWLGITLKNDFPALAKNTWVHTLELPQNLVNTKNVLLK